MRFDVLTRRRARAPRIRLLSAALVVVAALLTLAEALPGAASTPDAAWTVASPGRALTAGVAARRGELVLTVQRGDRQVLEASLGPAGRTDAARAEHAQVDDRFTTPAGKRREHQLRAERLTLTLDGGRQVEVLAADDGVAFRQGGFGAAANAWRAPSGTRAWLQPFRTNYEQPYHPGALADTAPGDYAFPALLRTGAGDWALLTESGLPRGSAAAHLTVASGRSGELAVTLPPGEASGGESSWRVAVVGDLQAIVGSDLALALGRPSQVAGTSWIRPGRVAWSWWSDSASPGNLEHQRAYVRSAAAAGWEYVLLDAGWKPEWAPELVRYAARLGVRVLVWTSWDQIAAPADRDRLLDQWAAWGVAGVKVDFLLSDSAARMAVYDDIAAAAARRHMVVGFHGCTLPRGIQRTWPNVLTLEAVRGAEHEKADMEGEAIAAAHDVDLVFTRNAVGSMDYTPVTFSAPNRATTPGHRLALAVAFESGLQHFADSPGSYGQLPVAARMLADVPAAWDDTRLVAGEPDRDATIARRSGEDWWLGTVAAGEARAQAVPLGFLAPGRRYRAHVVRDDGPRGLVVEERVVARGDTLDVPLARDGGFVARLTPLP